MPRNPSKKKCGREGCRAYARRDSDWCAAHQSERRDECSDATEAGRVKPKRAAHRKRARTGSQTDAASSFYAPSLTDDEREAIPAALRVEGLDQEIAMLRVRLRSIMEEYPERFDLQLQAVRLLVKAVSVKYRLSQKSEDDLYQNMLGVLRGIGGAIWPEAFDDAGC